MSTVLKKELLKNYVDNIDILKDRYSLKLPDSYLDIVKNVLECMVLDNEYGYPDIKKIHEIDDGDYQGTLVFIVPEKAYQPSTYWYIRVYYGSCSGCDELQAIVDYNYEKPNEQQINDIMALSLHVAQNLKQMDDNLD